MIRESKFYAPKVSFELIRFLFFTEVSIEILSAMLKILGEMILLGKRIVVNALLTETKRLNDEAN